MRVSNAVLFFLKKKVFPVDAVIQWIWTRPETPLLTSVCGYLGVFFDDFPRGGIKTKNADNVRVFGEFQTPPSPPQNADIFGFFSPYFLLVFG